MMTNINRAWDTDINFAKYLENQMKKFNAFNFFEADNEARLESFKEFLNCITLDDHETIEDNLKKWIEANNQEEEELSHDLNLLNDLMVLIEDYIFYNEIPATLKDVIL